MARREGAYPEDLLNQLRSSIEARGFTPPVLIDVTGMVLAGSGRVAAAQSLGLSEVPCLAIEEMSEAEKHAYFVAQHKLALEAGWDEALLVSEMRGFLEGADELPGASASHTVADE